MKIIPNVCTGISEKNKKREILKKILLILFVFFSVFSFSQTLSSELNKKTVVLGEPAFMRIKIANLQGKDVVSAPKNELLPFHFEEIKDNIAKQKDSYQRDIEFVIFEEGKFTIPALEFKIDGEVFHTIPYEIEVINPAQKGDQINDIMKNKEVKLGVKDYWELYKWYILGVLIVLALIFIIFQILRYGKQKKSSPAAMTNQTLKDLEILKKKKYIETGNYRSFYVELIDISRNFITRQYGIPADVLLTEDLIDVMKLNNTISPKNEKTVEEIFLRGDLVKFAKTFPGQQTMEKDFNEIKEFVKHSVKDLELENLRKDV